MGGNNLVDHGASHAVKKNSNGATVPYLQKLKWSKVLYGNTTALYVECPDINRLKVKLRNIGVTTTMFFYKVSGGAIIVGKHNFERLADMNIDAAAEALKNFGKSR